MESKAINSICLGGIIGDIIGSPYEFDWNNIKTKDFDLFSDKSHFTDDTIMTIAIMEALLNCDINEDYEYNSKKIIASMKKWGSWYPNAGYGLKFNWWLQSNIDEPYNSCGNGSAMRVSPVGWIYDNLEDTRRMARITAKVTHNHPEGIKGADATVSAIYLARTGKSKEEIKNYIEKEFNYDLNRTCDDIRPIYNHVETCQKTVPEAIIAFLEGTSFEDCIRNAVSLGGDSDTLTCITGSIAEAYYGIPRNISNKALEYLDEEFKDVLIKFSKNAKLYNKEMLDSCINKIENEKVEFSQKYCAYIYPDKLYENLYGVFPGIDLEYLENYKKLDLENYKDFTYKEINTFITFCLRGERFCDGLIAIEIESGRLLEILKLLKNY